MAYQIALALLGEKDYRAMSRLKKKELRAQYQSPLLHPLVKAQLAKHVCQKHFELGGWPKQVNMTVLDHLPCRPRRSGAAIDPPDAPEDEDRVMRSVSPGTRARLEKRYWDFEQHIEMPIGTFWGGPRAGLKAFRQHYEELLRELTYERKATDDDQPMLWLLWLRHPDLFQVLRGNWHSAGALLE
eukprot:g16938.t1